ncbi:MAG: hypothetical protein ABIN74_11700 [Ferruginibacter sp.]
MKQLLLLLLLSISIKSVTAQTATCTVLLDSLKGTYDGDCKSGKANGNGKAVGIHIYDGEFKNGVPEGKGKYIWANGDYYYGNWKKGQKEGKGELHRFESGKEIVVKGYWKKDNFKGEYENPYVVTNTTSDIGRLQVTKMSSTEATISVTVESLNSNQSLGSSAFATGTVMTSHQVTRGTYISKSNNAMTNKEITTFRGVVFPFRATFNFGNAIVEIEFFEKGAWDVVVPINK